MIDFTLSSLPDTDYTSRFTLTYPTAYLIPGQREAYQQVNTCKSCDNIRKIASFENNSASNSRTQYFIYLGSKVIHCVYDRS